MGSFCKEKTKADFRLNDQSIKLLDGKMKMTENISFKALIWFFKHHLNVVICEI